MYQIKTDCHVHTILSGHAYSTVEECAVYAAKQELEGIVITDHFCPIREEEFGDKMCIRDSAEADEPQKGRAGKWLS